MILGMLPDGQGGVGTGLNNKPIQLAALVAADFAGNLDDAF